MKLLLSFLFVFFTNCIAAQLIPKPFSIKGVIKNQSSGFIKLDYINNKGEYINDSARIVNGRFIFKGIIAHPFFADIYGDIVTRGTNDINFNSIFIEPGIMQVVLEKDNFKNLKLHGSKTQKQVDTHNNSYPNKMLVDSLTRLMYYFEESIKRNSFNISYVDSVKNLRNQLEPFYREINKRDYDFMVKNHKSYFSVSKLDVLLYRLPLDSAKKIFHTFSPELKMSYYGKRISSNIRAIEGGAPGTMAKNFSTIDQNGNSVSLEQFKGKNYVLLDFWATWCKPCVEELPHFEALANSLKGKKFKMYLVTTDMRKDIATRVTDFIKSKGLTQQVIFINEVNADKWINKVSEEWTGAIPATWFLKGNIGYEKFYEGELSQEELAALVKLVMP